jgi:hypothetical protein
MKFAFSRLYLTVPFAEGHLSIRTTIARFHQQQPRITLDNRIPIKQLGFCGCFQAAATVSDTDAQMRTTPRHPMLSGDLPLSNIQIRPWFERDNWPINFLCRLQRKMPSP